MPTQAALAKKYVPVDTRELFYMLLWALWVEHNATVWRGSTFRPLNTAAWASKLLSDYQAVHPTHVKRKMRQRTKWLLPPSGRLKLNTNGVYHGSTGQGGIGAVTRDEFGVCLAAIARPFSHVSSAFQMELEAMRACLLLIIHQGMDGVDIETDYATVVTALKGNMEDLS
ncbi:uncharacterized protein LOC112167268 [Rosa chinensis]|uniref:uncharacterized protein LOC112167268 n=1 Tax=Rosa chinensis TaxID=74649 RepID=UPI000D095681|nr:uncharacterized protein LOC112167268 [Rosa chinensis]